jgi:hypothetical protein
VEEPYKTRCKRRVRIVRLGEWSGDVAPAEGWPSG